jgi:rubrerythrin
MKSKKLLKEAIIDEKIAPKQYLKIKNSLKNKGDKKVISGIIRDERRHLKAIKKIERRLK